MHLLLKPSESGYSVGQGLIYVLLQLLNGVHESIILSAEKKTICLSILQTPNLIYPLVKYYLLVYHQTPLHSTANSFLYHQTQAKV